MASAEINKQDRIPRDSPAEISVESADPVTQNATAVESSGTVVSSQEANKQDGIPPELSAQSSMASTAAIAQNATTVEHSESATPSVAFTEQQSPLLRLPAELRNRIYGEVFRSFFEGLEKRRA
jgi:hypothetical protein